MHRIDLRFREIARTHSGLVAVDDGETRLTFVELDRVSDDVARALSVSGIDISEPVIVPVSTLAVDLAGFIGVWRAGGVAVPLHRGMPVAAAEPLLKRLGARLMVNPARVAPVWFGSAGDLVTRLSEALPPARPLLSGAGTIIFTSGSTGLPKGVVLSADRQADKLDMIRGEIGFEAGQSMLVGLQLTFSFGQWTTWLTLLGGGTAHLRRRFDPERMLEEMAALNVDRWPVVPTMMRRVLTEPGADAESGWSGTVMAGGEPLPAALGHRWLDMHPATRLGDIFGLTETGTCDFFVKPEEYRQDAGSIGRAGLGIDWRLDDAGGLEIRSPFAMLGYLDDPEKTAETLRDGYIATGDLAETDKEGRVRLIGRAKDLVVRAGNKIAPLEVEAALLAEPTVGAALVAGVPDAQNGEAVVAALVPAPGKVIDLDRLRAALSERLERYKVPDRFMVLEDLPGGATGKADRGALRRLISEKEEKAGLART